MFTFEAICRVSAARRCRHLLRSVEKDRLPIAPEEARPTKSKICSSTTLLSERAARNCCATTSRLSGPVRLRDVRRGAEPGSWQWRKIWPRKANSKKLAATVTMKWLRT